MRFFDKAKVYIGNLFSSKGKKVSSGGKVQFKYGCMYNDWMRLSRQYSSQGLESIVVHSVGDEDFNLKKERGKAEANACDRGINLVVEVYWDNGSVMYYGLKQRVADCVSQVPAQDCSSRDPLASGHYLELETVGTVDFSGVEETYDGEAARRRARIIEMAQD